MKRIILSLICMLFIFICSMISCNTTTSNNFSETTYFNCYEETSEDTTILVSIESTSDTYEVELETDMLETVEETTEQIYEDSCVTCETSKDVNYYNITEEERELVSRLVYQEAGVYSFELKKGVASIIFNRLESGCWKVDVNQDGNVSLYDIIYYPNAFSPAYLLEETTPNIECYEAVDYVVRNGPTLPTYVRYFRINYDFNWENYKNYTVIDNTYFGYFVNWEEGIW